jgi:hypothetical protein
MLMLMGLQGWLDERMDNELVGDEKSMGEHMTPWIAGRAWLTSSPVLTAQARAWVVALGGFG